MTIHISGAELAGDWAPFLSQLPGWRIDGARWRSPSSHARDRRTRTRAVLSGVASPCGLPDTQVIDSEPWRADRFQLCHASYAVPDVAVASDTLAAKLMPRERFGRQVVYDPCSETVRSDAHLIRRGRFYITLFSGTASRLDHVGWWCSRRSDVDLAAKILAAAGWPIALGPTVVDGSYLVHFRAPDGAVHDVFAFEGPPDAAPDDAAG